MPVIKYRSFEEAQKAMWCFWPTREYYRKLADLFEFSNQIFSHFQRPLPGILKYKSLDQSGRRSIDQIDQTDQMTKQTRQTRRTR